MMTFEQWRALGREVPDLCALPEVGMMPDEGPMPGRIYPSGLHIEKGRDQWYLTIENCSWGSPDLQALEARLYTFGVDQRCIPTGELRGTACTST